jgi:hypothetical protein
MLRLATKPFRLSLLPQLALKGWEALGVVRVEVILAAEIQIVTQPLPIVAKTIRWNGLFLQE